MKKTLFIICDNGINETDLFKFKQVETQYIPYIKHFNRFGIVSVNDYELVTTKGVKTLQYKIHDSDKKLSIFLWSDLKNIDLLSRAVTLLNFHLFFFHMKDVFSDTVIKERYGDFVSMNAYVNWLKDKFIENPINFESLYIDNYGCPTFLQPMAQLYCRNNIKNSTLKDVLSTRNKGSLKLQLNNANGIYSSMRSFIFGHINIFE